MKKEKVEVFDTTLRDGTQGELVSFSVEDKLRIAEGLDDLGVHYIEGGWPGSNPKDVDFFKKAQKLKLKNARISAFGSTAHPRYKVQKDPNLHALLKAETPVITIFGKTWDFHVTVALKISLAANLALIEDSVRFLKSKNRMVIFDAEHFFDGYVHNPEYAVKALLAAQTGGADILCLCETNGGKLPHQVREIMSAVAGRVSIPLGIHAHNDSGCGVANSVEGVLAGARMVQGTINGYGERCGNADLCCIIPNLMLKMNYSVLSSRNLKKITRVSRFVSELTNLSHNERLPYVGNSAFAHKGGIHVSAVQKARETYEHIKPEQVGNHQRVLISELSGQSNLVYKAEKFGLKVKKGDPQLKPLLNKLKELESQGYQFEAAEASFEIIIMKGTGKFKKLFDVEGFRVINEKRFGNPTHCEATIKILYRGREELTAAEGSGPVNALDNALRKAIYKFYPVLSKVKLEDYKVRVLEGKCGTGAKVRVMIESSDGLDKWGTVGVSENIIEASWNALLDSLNYYLIKKAKKR